MRRAALPLLALLACGGPPPAPQVEDPVKAPAGATPALDPNRPRSRAEYEQRRRDEADARAGLQPGERMGPIVGPTVGLGAGPGGGPSAPPPAQPCAAGRRGALLVISGGERRELSGEALWSKASPIAAGRHAGAPGVPLRALVGAGPARAVDCTGAAHDLDPAALDGLRLVMNRKGALKLIQTVGDEGRVPQVRDLTVLEGAPLR